MIKLTSLYPVIALTALVLAMPAMAGGQEHAEAEVVDEKALRCINTRLIRRTEILDDLNIIFYVSGQKAYRNFLPRRCSGLAREKRFSYRTSGNRLCDLDTITVLRDGAFGLDQGVTCPLGSFHPITREDADALLDPTANEPEARPIELPPPQEIGATTEKPES